MDVLWKSNVINKRCSGLITIDPVVITVGNIVDRFHWLQAFGSKGESGYFHSFEAECKIDDLRMLWVEFSDPKTRQNKDRDVNTLEQLNEIQFFQRM
jgi:hypothetical protein